MDVSANDQVSLESGASCTVKRNPVERILREIAEAKRPKSDKELRQAAKQAEKDTKAKRLKRMAFVAIKTGYYDAIDAEIIDDHECGNGVCN